MGPCCSRFSDEMWMSLFLRITSYNESNGKIMSELDRLRAERERVGW